MTLPKLVDNLTQQEKKISEKINLFNDAYAHYVRCYGSEKLKVNTPLAQTYPNLSKTTNNSNYCSTYTISFQSESLARDDLNTKYSDVVNEITKGNNILSEIHQKGYTDYSNITTTYKQNLKTRNDLDLKLKEIYEEEGTTQRNLKIDYDSTIYASIAWSVLATSLIYYVFVKL
jgi:hypothetical protein